MADPITPQTPIPSFNLNLEPAAVPTPEPVSPVVPTLNIAPAVDQTVTPIADGSSTITDESNIKPAIDQTIDTGNTAIEQIIEVKTEQINTENITAEVVTKQTTPIVLDISVTPNSNNLEKSIQNPNTIKNKQAQTPEENNQTPPTDDRLKKEDELVQKQVEIVTPATIPTLEPISPVVELQSEAAQETTPVVEPVVTETKLPSTDLQKDLQIIQNLQQTPVAPVTPTVSTPSISIPQTPAETAKPTPANNSLNLDSIAVTIPQIPVPQAPVIPTIGTIAKAPQIAPNPYDHMQNYIPQIAPSTQTNKSQGKGGIIGISIGIVFIILAWFVIKTMYPLQYKGIVSGILGTDEESISTEITSSLDGSGDINSDFGSGDILLGSGENILDDGLIDTGVLEGLTGDVHNITDTETTTNTEPSIMETNLSLEELKTKLEEYSKQGKAKLVEAKRTNNKELIKDSLALYKTADGYLQDIANGKEMTTTDMENISKELLGYLHKIDPTANVEVTTGTKETNTPINSGSPDFNPDEFFSESGSTQK